MILPQVSELLARVARRPVVEETFEALRRTGGEVRLAGLTASAKALLIPMAFVIYDLSTIKRLTRATLWGGGAILVVHLARTPISETSVWLAVAHWIGSLGL